MIRGSVLLLLSCASAFAQTHFHHAHLNSTDPKAAIEWYTAHLSGEKAKFNGNDAIWTQQSWLLIDKVSKAPPSEPGISGLFHIGWGAEDMKAEFERQIKLGTTFQTPLTDGVELFGTGTRDRNFFMYLDGPDHVTIEVQSAQHHNFMHVHMFSEDPIAAAEWYAKHLQLPLAPNQTKTERVFRSIPTAPMGSIRIDNVSLLWFPTGHAKALYGAQWIGRKEYSPNRGRAFDHIAFSVDNLDAALTRLKSEGVKIVSGPKVVKDARTAFIQAPDNVEVELVEGQAKR